MSWSTKLKSLYRRLIRPSLCPDCKLKLDRKAGIRSKIKHRAKKSYHGARGKIHYMRVRIGRTHKYRKQAYITLSSGKRRFVKNR